MNTLAALAVFSGLSLNLLLQFGLGIRETTAITKGNEPIRSLFLQWLALFLSVLLIWLFFSYIISPLSLGFFEYFLLFPLTVGVSRVLEEGFNRLFPVLSGSPKIFSAKSGYDGLILVSLFLTLRLALTVTEAMVLSAGFSLGTILAIFIVLALHKRSSLESVPPFLRGLPLLVISVGLLSLIFSFIAAILLRVVGIF
ncbi:hypothetical protein FACS189493_0770 [Spirochaetia bacterium]|nr:hypothetical protein FACS189493_0770 [Spirochaetia bacterium]